MTDVYTPQAANQDAAYTPPVTGPQQTAMYLPEAEPERVNREAPYYAASQGLALLETFEDARITDRFLGFVGADADRRFDAHRRRMFGDNAPQLLSPAEANEQFGVEGRLTFDRPIDRNIAAWQQSQAQREAFRDEVVANADLSWWQTMGASFAGSLLDPLGLPLWLAPELAAGRALRSGAAASRLGRMPAFTRGALTGGAEGIAGGVVYEGANLWLHHMAADDYDFGQASANVLLGGVLGAGVGAVGGWWEGRSMRTARAPAAVEALDDDARLGAFAQALDDLIEDRPVDLGPVLRRAIESGELRPREVLEGLDDLDAGADWRARVPETVDIDGVMTSERWGVMAEPERLRWLADDQLRAERGRLAVLERALMPDDLAPPPSGTARADLEVEVARSRDRIGELERVSASGDLRADPVLRSLARVTKGGAPSSVARQMIDRLNDWYTKPGDGPGPVAAAKAKAAAKPAAPARAAKPTTPKGQRALPKGEPYADPEVAALAADTEAMLLREGVTPEDLGGADPQTIADAIAAGAACLMKSAA